MATLDDLAAAVAELRVEHGGRLQRHEERLDGHGREVVELRAWQASVRSNSDVLFKKLDKLDERVRQVEMRIYAAVVVVGALLWALERLV